ncbi:MAG: hypothetical protein IT162_01960 [Bryobacterales bacterium]|nr:hypothetical protein [Bryobacterales bacterium]
MSKCKCSPEKSSSCRFEYQYAVKAVCGTVPECRPGDPPQPVAPGLYFTAINIRNAAACEVAEFNWHVADAWARPGFVSGRQVVRLNPGAAVEVDCPDIAKMIPAPAPPFSKGFVVIESEVELDVVAVYTGTQGENWPLNTLHMERVAPRCTPVNEDFELLLNTGNADWRTASTGQPVIGVTPDAAWTAPPFGASWVDRDGLGTLGSETYRLSFELCCGFRNPQLQMSVSTDNAGEVRFNGNLLLNLSSNSYQSLTAVPPPPASQYVVGQNTLEVRVTNQGTSSNPKGFVAGGFLRVPRGKCHCGRLPYRQLRATTAGENLGQ